MIFGLSYAATEPCTASKTWAIRARRHHVVCQHVWPAEHGFITSRRKDCFVRRGRTARKFEIYGRESGRVGEVSGIDGRCVQAMGSVAITRYRFT